MSVYLEIVHGPKVGQLNICLIEVTLGPVDSQIATLSVIQHQSAEWHS